MILRPPRTPAQDAEVAAAIVSAIRSAKAHKPSDRSEQDRAYAVTITELEKAHAYFVVYAAAPPAIQVGEDDEEGQTPPTIESFTATLRKLIAELKAATPDEIDPDLAAAAIARFEQSLSRFDALQQGAPHADHP